MSKTFIWDLDGTLVDSYGSILGNLLDLYHEFGFDQEPDKVHKMIIDGSVGTFTAYMDQITPLPYAEMRKQYDQKRAEMIAAGLPVRTYDIPAIPHVKDALAALKAQGAGHMIYTHRNKGTFDILGKLDMLSFFDDIVTSEFGLARKPSPDGVLYLMEKHGLDPAETFYVGDRTLDMDCAKAAGIQGILFLPEGSLCDPDGAESYIVSDLRDIAGLPLF